MSNYTYEEVLKQVLHLTPEDQLELLKVLTNIVLPRVTIRPQHSILEFEGMAKEYWKGVDVEKFINEERNSWDG
jgi:hypothetical protein